jgi:hypothetical protein
MSAEVLYGLIHARYVLTSAGLAAVNGKYQVSPSPPPKPCTLSPCPRRPPACTSTRLACLSGLIELRCADWRCFALRCFALHRLNNCEHSRVPVGFRGPRRCQGPRAVFNNAGFVLNPNPASFKTADGLERRRAVRLSAHTTSTFVRVQSVEYGRCPHVLCEGQAVLPVGQSDVPRVSTVKVRLRLTTHTYTRLTTHARHARPAALPAAQSDLPQAVCHGSATP